MSMAGMSILSVRDLVVRRSGVDVVRGVTFSADRGEIVALTGASGSGKTTVLRAINNSSKPLAPVP